MKKLITFVFALALFTGVNAQETKGAQIEFEQEVIDYGEMIKPKVAIPVHDAIAGNDIFVKIATAQLGPMGVEVRVLEKGIGVEF